MRVSLAFILIFPLTLLAASILPSCASRHATSSTLNPPGDYKAAVAFLEQEKFAEAFAGFDKFIQQNAASSWSQEANYNSARALEGLNRWDEAIERYRQVVRATDKAPRLRAMALYRMSFCHEALGDDPQVVADLNDLIDRTHALPSEIAEGELPARLAGAYARVGNFDRAQVFYRRAEMGIAKLRQASREKVPEWLPRTLFAMGESSRRSVSWSDFEIALRPFARSQIYLLEAAELGQEPWATKAADELIAGYNSLLDVIEGAPLPAGDPVIAKRSVQQIQWSRTALMIETLNDLRARLSPDSKSVPAVQKIVANLKLVDKKMAAILEERPAGEGLTAAAIARKKSKQPLKALATDDSLEQQFLKSSRENKPVQIPAPIATPAPIVDTEIHSESPSPIRAAPTPPLVPTTPSSDDPNL